MVRTARSPLPHSRGWLKSVEKADNLSGLWALTYILTSGGSGKNNTKMAAIINDTGTANNAI
ncbi:Uncharacterised protein (plasmid) [Legionella adelaidensis]|uniref:Uncharacterized protein n=1 Tax=Legionella adelaidensis TaxID=45056 RepID=A0A0W0R3E6_9GAMM|nr:hypothetical protein Lade_0257 [Legionella adelaidensis]VEH85204.1 Uncharacterised protein [Legionella adelaidensis]